MMKGKVNVVLPGQKWMTRNCEKKKTTKSESWISTLEEQGYPLSAPP